MRRGAVTALTAVLLAGPPVLAFPSGGFFPQARLAAGIGAWAVLGVTVLVVPGPVLPRTWPVRAACSASRGSRRGPRSARRGRRARGRRARRSSCRSLYLPALAAAALLLRPRGAARRGRGRARRRRPRRHRLRPRRAAPAGRRAPRRERARRRPPGAAADVLERDRRTRRGRPRARRADRRRPHARLGAAHRGRGRGPAARSRRLPELLARRGRRGRPSRSWCSSSSSVARPGAGGRGGGRRVGAGGRGGGAVRRRPGAGRRARDARARGPRLRRAPARDHRARGVRPHALCAADGRRRAACPAGRAPSVVGVGSPAARSLPYAAALAERGAPLARRRLARPTARLAQARHPPLRYWRVALRRRRRPSARRASGRAASASSGCASGRSTSACRTPTRSTSRRPPTLAWSASRCSPAVRRRPRRRGAARPSSDRALAAGPAAAALTWALHAGLDWDWEMPAVTLVAVALAGLLLAGPARRPDGGDELARPGRARGARSAPATTAPKSASSATAGRSGPACSPTARRAAPAPRPPPPRRPARSGPRQQVARAHRGQQRADVARAHAELDGDRRRSGPTTKPVTPATASPGTASAQNATAATTASTAGGSRALVGAIEREPVEAELAHRGGDRQPLDERAGRAATRRRARRSMRSPAKSTAPAARGSTHSSVARLERTNSSSSAARPPADGADRRVDRRGDDLCRRGRCSATSVAASVTKPTQPGRVEVEGEDLALGDDERRDERDEDRAPRSAGSAARRRGRSAGPARYGEARSAATTPAEVAGRRADDEAPHAHAGRGERDGDGEGDDRARCACSRRWRA